MIIKHRQTIHHLHAIFTPMRPLVALKDTNLPGQWDHNLVFWLHTIPWLKSNTLMERVPEHLLNSLSHKVFWHILIYDYSIILLWPYLDSKVISNKCQIHCSFQEYRWAHPNREAAGCYCHAASAVYTGGLLANNPWLYKPKGDMQTALDVFW